MKKLLLHSKHFIILLSYSLYLTILLLKFFSNVYLPNFYIILDFPLNINYLINFTKLCFPLTTLLTSTILSHSIYLIYVKKKNNTTQKLVKVKSINVKLNSNFKILLGTDEYSNNIYLNEPALYQNILITGSIGSGKTSSLIYPLIFQLLQIEKVSGLILDVKGNMYSDILQICQKNKKLHLLHVIELNSNSTYNPLHKPNLKPYILANRLITILSLFSNKNNSDTYWFDKAEHLLTEAIKLIRLYNNRICYIC